MALSLCACEGCRTPKTSTTVAPTEGEAPTARLFLVSDLAGALEPCGCVKDQLGGMDHFGALVQNETPKAKGSAVLSAGPLFFMDPELATDRTSQEVAKAETIASSLKATGLVGFAPARNEWAAGEATLSKLQSLSGAPMLAANVTGKAGAAASTVKEIGGLKIGVIGVASDEAAKAAGVTTTPSAEAVRRAALELEKQGVSALVVLAAVGRGEAKRIADANPNLLAIVVGETGSTGDANTKAAPAEQIGDVLIVEAANHLQTVGVLDLFVRGSVGPGLVKFADGTGLERIKKREELEARITELRARIATWETDKSVDKRDVDARRADVAKLEAERDAQSLAAPPASGSFYRYAMRDVRDKLGADEAVKAQMLAYYKHVNESNKAEFADRKPKPTAKGEAGYAGVDACTECHEAPRAVWDKTAHARAYATLSDQFKEYNLDCVSCHVTGYDRPGGSTVTHVEGLKNVQCEVCHGPGKLHAENPDKAKIPVAHPQADSCLSCHHPPHVHTFDAKAKMNDILGPGHGRPKR